MAVLTLALGWPASAGAGVGMGWGQWTADISFAQCISRSAKALTANGLSVERHDRFFFGSSSGPSSASISCYSLATTKTVVTIVVGSIPDAQGRHPSAELVTKLAEVIFGSDDVTTGETGWNANATSHRGRNGQRFSYTCPAGGSAGSVWGTDVYTDDSSVCTAAVHTGLITLAGGGKVTIEMRAGQPSYKGTTRNGIGTSSYGAWSGSFVIVGAPSGGGGGGGGGGAVSTGGADWRARADTYRGRNGQRYAYTCPANGAAATVWGTDTYTDDSSVCTAAVHAGLITFAAGGKVTIEIRAGQATYTGSTRNGVSTSNYGSWHGSFVFVR